VRAKKEAPAWDRGPRRVRFVASVVFTPARGVIHPSFPLRGRWERIVKSDEQAPSPSLATLLNSSFEPHSRGCLMHGPHQCRPWTDFTTSHLLTSTCPRRRLARTAPIPYSISVWNRSKAESGTGSLYPHGFPASTQFQDPGNKFFRLSALSVLGSFTSTISSCARCFSTAPIAKTLCSLRRHYSPV